MLNHKIRLEYDCREYEKLKDLKIPPSEEGFIPSLNNYGYMLEFPDAYSQKFIDYAKEKKGFFLDIGAAYGVATIEALKKGAYVIANDIDGRHLYILWKRAPYHLRKNLSLKIGKFPHEVNFPDQTFNAILASGVLHYLTGRQLEQAFKKIFHLLTPRGKFFFFTSTPYIGIFKDYLPIFNQLKDQKVKWPGLISNSWIYASQRKHCIPKRINLLDEDTLITIFKNIGFKIEEKSYVSMSKYPKDIQNNGKEYIGFVLKKP